MFVSRVVPVQKTDGRPVQILDVRDIQAFAHHDGLARIEIGRDLDKAERGIALQGELEVADQQVDLARLQHREADFRGRPDIFHLLRVAERRGRHRAAERDIEPLPFPGGILIGVAGNAGIDATYDLPPLLDGIESRALYLTLRPGCACEANHAGDESRDRLGL